ncbi:hypothetical protein LTR56_019289 [Elasticomyces elasticus]|nr:hypothetical protein LTR56_019289 [Elasticomyces elasticus]KAK3635302.1 hypothetical protein LTR22_019230 [Elasticomyces elasticus]KAK4931637.1 hypothetical protein LTR49_002029 [Elasticomyces elasticus]KAK5749465.1 hypothetical protein LTS12_020458 [Elasticomyces elasticus]
MPPKPSPASQAALALRRSHYHLDYSQQFAAAEQAAEEVAERKKVAAKAKREEKKKPKPKKAKDAVDGDGDVEMEDAELGHRDIAIPMTAISCRDLVRLFRRFGTNPQNHIIQDRIISYCVASTSFVPAKNPITQMQGLVSQKGDLTGLFRGTDRWRRVAETAFWETNTIAVENLAEAGTMVLGGYKSLVKRLYLAYEMDVGVRYSGKAVTTVLGRLKAGLVEFKGLESLVVACVYVDAGGRREDIVRGVEKGDELRVLVEAVGKLGVREKVVVLRDKGGEAGVGEVMMSIDDEAVGRVRELLMLDVGEGLAWV